MFCFRLPQIYDEFYHTVNNADHEKGRENEKRTAHCLNHIEEGYSTDLLLYVRYQYLPPILRCGCVCLGALLYSRVHGGTSSTHIHTQLHTHPSVLQPVFWIRIGKKNANSLS
jgi:hypothetical protein